MNYNPIITCSDGFTISVQGHAASYSTRDDSGVLTKVECGFPSTTPKTAELLRYAEDIDFTETVYGWVPVDVVQAELDAHGGILDGRLPKQNFSKKPIEPIKQGVWHGRSGPRCLVETESQ